MSDDSDLGIGYRIAGALLALAMFLGVLYGFLKLCGIVLRWLIAF